MKNPELILGAVYIQGKIREMDQEHYQKLVNHLLKNDKNRLNKILIDTLKYMSEMDILHNEEDADIAKQMFRFSVEILLNINQVETSDGELIYLAEDPDNKNDYRIYINDLTQSENLEEDYNDQFDIES